MKIFSGKTSVIAMALALLIASSVMLTGCDGDNSPADTTATTTAPAGDSADKAKEINIDTAADTIFGKLKTDDTLEKLDSEAVIYRYGFAEEIPAAVYAGSGATAEEVAVFDAGSDDAAKALVTTMEKYIEEQIISYESYVPAEVARLDKAIIDREGRYVAVCVTYDVTNAKNAINEAFGR